MFDETKKMCPRIIIIIINLREVIDFNFIANSVLIIGEWSGCL
jgi:hypothetical protein